MFLAAIIACTTPLADDCNLLVNRREIYESYDSCILSAAIVAKGFLDSGVAATAKPYCFEVDLGELVNAYH